MSTQFPSFAPKTTNPLWFSVGEPGDDEAELRTLEAKYKKWMKSIIDKDKDAPYIGKKPDAMQPTEPEPEGESEESEDEEDLNGFQDSPEDQNPGIQAGYVYFMLQKETVLQTPLPLNRWIWI
uniref:Anaphase-promoting complex subunit 15B-like n=1 Tax=Phallusia mammillata TaxID=59560 RepID=A0A6F9D6V7_9ASCI|nr:anaphase-promoting complex subunit 15B-like [Phallusia mammillata]